MPNTGIVFPKAAVHVVRPGAVVALRVFEKVNDLHESVLFPLRE